MSDDFTYEHYVKDEEFLRGYNAYQEKYASQVRESDKVIVNHVRGIVSRHHEGKRPLRLLDIGCSTGNLLLHLKRLVPGIELTGADLAESSLAQCRAAASLDGVSFEMADLLNLPYQAAFDVITVNAVLYMMADDQFEQSLRSVHRALSPGGTLIAFDFFHQFEQDVAIMEVSKSHVDGLRIRFRPISRVSQLLARTGYGPAEFEPFSLPIDLPRPEDDSELITYSVAASDGRRLAFRGVLFQPWCHLFALKASK